MDIPIPMASVISPFSPTTATISERPFFVAVAPPFQGEWTRPVQTVISADGRRTPINQPSVRAVDVGQEGHASLSSFDGRYGGIIKMFHVDVSSEHDVESRAGRMRYSSASRSTRLEQHE